MGVFIVILNCVRIPYRVIFTALHAMQTRYSDKNSVRPSVCLSVTRVYCDNTEEKLSRFLYHTKDNLA